MEGDAIALAVREALWLTVQLGAPPLLAMLAIGLAVSVLQALTSVQEQTLAFLPKLAALGVMLLLLGPAMAGALRGFAAALFTRIVSAALLP